jgi:hypothetical protein
MKPILEIRAIKGKPLSMGYVSRNAKLGTNAQDLTIFRELPAGAHPDAPLIP